MSIEVDKLSEAIAQELKNYNQLVVEGTKKEAKKAMDRLVKKTKETAPTRRPKYKKSITSKKTRDDKMGAEYTWYVKGSEYRLSHLLEKGHAKKNGGRTKAFHFIKKATDPIVEDFIEAVEEIAKNG